MGKTTGISWTDHTFNPWAGCTKVSPGCKNCYAERDSKRFPDLRGVWGDDGTRVVRAEGSWREVLTWQAEAGRAGVRRRVFCASIADWLEDWRGLLQDHRGDTLYVDPEGRWYPAALGFVPGPRHRALTLDDVRARLLAWVARTPDLDWLLLSKRVENLHTLLTRAVASVPGSNGMLDDGVALGSAWLCGDPPRNVVLMTTAENQEYAELRVPLLLKCPAYRYGLSVEPQLGPVDLAALKCGHLFDGEGAPYYDALRGCSFWGGTGDFGGHGPALHWVISGGESGPGARPFDIGWARDLRDSCRAAGVAFFLKQVGDNPCFVHREPPPPVVVGFNPGGRHGADPDAWPDDLRVRDFYPPVAAHELRAAALGKSSP